MKLPSYPKIYNLGHRYLNDLFKGEVVVQEKVDGSQISFGYDDEGILRIRSKGAIIHPEAPPKLFAKAVNTINNLDLLPGYTYRGEAICSLRHNAITYGREPLGNIVLFDMDIPDKQEFLVPTIVAKEAKRLGIESIPTLYEGCISSGDQVRELLTAESFLGGMIEGVVVKNYNRFGLDGKVLMGKWVQARFKEIHDKTWKKDNPQKADLMESLLERYRTHQRWEKAIGHLRDNNQITDSPKDIGPLIGAVITDVKEECEDEIKEILFKHYWKDLSRRLTHGLPEWYKELLLDEQEYGKNDESE